MCKSVLDWSVLCQKKSFDNPYHRKPTIWCSNVFVTSIVGIYYF